MLDLTLRAPGPYCTWILGDLGADVLRVEEPHSRAREDTGDAAEEMRRAAHDVLGRNKRSLALNLKTAEAQEIFHRLCVEADAVIEGFRPGVVQRLGVDYETLRSINPRIIYCSLSGFGQTGPYRGLPGHDINYIALGGALGITGHSVGPPAIPANLLADFAGGGMQAAIGVLVALLHRERTGEGQQIDVAMSDGVVALMATAFSDYFATGEAPRPGETRLTGALPYYQSYLTKDGRYLSVGCLEPWFFDNLCRLLDLNEFLPHQHDPEQWQAMRRQFAERFRSRTRDEWWELFKEHDICGMPVLRLDEAAADPQLQARGMVLDLPHPALGSVRQVGIAPKFSLTPGAVRRLAPTVGEHTDEVLDALGYSAGQVQELRAAGVIR